MDYYAIIKYQYILKNGLKYENILCNIIILILYSIGHKTNFYLIRNDYLFKVFGVNNSQYPHY